MPEKKMPDMFDGDAERAQMLTSLLPLNLPSLYVAGMFLYSLVNGLDKSGAIRLLTDYYGKADTADQMLINCEAMSLTVLRSGLVEKLLESALDEMPDEGAGIVGMPPLNFGVKAIFRPPTDSSN